MNRAPIFVVAILLAASSTAVRADDPIVTVLADFEDNTVGAEIASVENVLAADCTARFEANPARGQRSLAVTIGATAPNAAAICELLFQFATPLANVDRFACEAWINEGKVDVAFRLRDAKGRLYDTQPVSVTATRRWTVISADIEPGKLKRVAGVAADHSAAPPSADDASPFAWPIEFVGYRVSTIAAARQTVFLDDLQVEHKVPPHDSIRGLYILDQPTHFYEPGVRVAAQLWIENSSRKQALQLSVQFAWRRDDGSELTRSQTSLNLPASGPRLRSRQSLDVSQTIADPGLYQLVATVRSSGWRSPAVFETTIAVTPGNRALPRGRETFFGVRSNLAREPLESQMLEIEAARDLGVQLLALDAPWRLLEPRQGTFELAPLSALVNAAAKRDMAVMLILRQPPEWVTKETPLLQQVPVIEAMAKSFGPAVRFYCPWLVPDSASADLADKFGTIQERLTAVQNTASIVPPPRSLADGSSPPAAAADFLSGFEIAGDPDISLLKLAEFSRKSGREWSRSDWWWQCAQPRSSAGYLYDAVAVLRYFVEAARSGVGAVVWFDLRDDTVDTRHLEQMRGLLHRDFSPKFAALGLANAVGMLGGLAYRGRAEGAPEEFDTALFMSGERQVVVLLPRPNRVLPAWLAIEALVPGDVAVYDFERRQLSTDTAAAPGLFRVTGAPMFVTLAPRSAQTDPQLKLDRPWLRVPSEVAMGESGTIPVEIDVRTDLKLSYVQLVLPPKSPFKSTFSGAEIKAEGGKPARFDIELKRSPGGALVRSAVTIRIVTESQRIEFPVEIRPLRDVSPLADGAMLPLAKTEIAQLRQPGADENVAGVVLAAAYSAEKLVVGFALPKNAKEGELTIGIAREGTSHHVEMRATDLVGDPKLQTEFDLAATAEAATRGWSVARRSDKSSGTDWIELTVPAEALGVKGLATGQRILLAARLSIAAERAASPTVYVFGSGLAGNHSTTGYEWIRLAPARP